MHHAIDNFMAAVRVDELEAALRAHIVVPEHRSFYGVIGDLFGINHARIHNTFKRTQTWIREDTLDRWLSHAGLSEWLNDGTLTVVENPYYIPQEG